ncbi:MAG: hypothetical protein Q8P22_12200 [Chloroflexota bacterium]|nr:hypothetical protein [Chloroflexota bacterium]
MSKVKRLAIRLALAEEKEKAYEEVDRLYHQGQKVESKEPAAGSSPSPWTAVSCTTQRVVPL